MPDDLKPPPAIIDRPFTPSELSSIALGVAEIEAGLGIEFEDAEAWLDRLEIDPDAPLPSPRVFQPIK